VKEFNTEIETAIHADAGAVFDVLSVHHILKSVVVMFLLLERNRETPPYFVAKLIKKWEKRKRK
jgi:hypothetical protein